MIGVEKMINFSC